MVKDHFTKTDYFLRHSLNRWQFDLHVSFIRDKYHVLDLEGLPSSYSESCELSSFLIKETFNLLQNSHFLYLPRKVKSGPLLRAIWTGQDTHNSELLLLWQYARQLTAMCWTIKHAIHWATRWVLGQPIQRAMLYGQYTMVMLSIGWVGGGQCSTPMTMRSDANTSALQRDARNATGKRCVYKHYN